jgi:primosomal protein N' (replication factor Y)
MRYADVIVPLAVEGMYTYTVPVSLESEVREGTLVLVSFAGNKRYTALVGRIHDQAPVGYQVKPIEDVIEKQVSFSALHLRFLLWLGGYYMATPCPMPKSYHRLRDALTLKEGVFSSRKGEQYQILSPCCFTGLNPIRRR